MKRARVLMMLGALFCGVLVVAACGAGGAGSTGSGTPTSGTPKAAKSKPTAVPKITVALCQQLLTVAEANQIMHPPKVATTIRIDTSAAGGSCNYEYAPYASVVSIVFHPYAGQPLSVLATQASAVAGASVKTTAVSGVGDQALFVAAKASGEGTTIWNDTLYVAYGSILISCGDFNVHASSSDAAQLAALTQIAQLVVGRI